MMQSNKQILEHIIPYCELISDSIKRFGNSYEAFLADDFYRLGIGAALSQLGELAKRFTSDFRMETEDDFHWKAIIGMRNHYAHGYEKMDTQTIWATATTDIPVLQRQCEEYLDRLYLFEQEEEKELDDDLEL